MYQVIMAEEKHFRGHSPDPEKMNLTSFLLIGP
jgi:hypothetical protein